MCPLLQRELCSALCRKPLVTIQKGSAEQSASRIMQRHCLKLFGGKRLAMAFALKVHSNIFSISLVRFYIGDDQNIENIPECCCIWSNLLSQSTLMTASVPGSTGTGEKFTAFPALLLNTFNTGASFICQTIRIKIHRWT